MKIAILAGGQGTRLVEETRSKSKALVEIGDRPILWHLLQYYRHFGFDEFVVALGYRADSIQAYFAAANGFHQDDAVASTERQRWRGDGLVVDLVDTGPTTENGGRVKRLAPYLGGERFMLTWCDGLSDVDLVALLEFHHRHGRMATLTAVRPPARFGRLTLDGDRVAAFDEKIPFEQEWINGAFFVLEPEVLVRIEGDHTSFERDVLHGLAAEGHLMAYRHRAFWQCMDTLKEAQDLDRLWRSGAAPWQLWELDDARAGHR
jgi:glucose-1-phosphate cytidylyltransferase